MGRRDHDGLLTIINRGTGDNVASASTPPRHYNLVEAWRSELSTIDGRLCQESHLVLPGVPPSVRGVRGSRLPELTLLTGLTVRVYNLLGPLRAGSLSDISCVLCTISAGGLGLFGLPPSFRLAFLCASCHFCCHVVHPKVIKNFHA